MSRVVLEFNLPEDRADYAVACKAQQLHACLWDMDQWLRSQIKYENIKSMDLQQVRDNLHYIMGDNHISFEAFEDFQS